MCNKCSAITTLLESGAGTGAADDDGDTALMESLFFDGGDALELLLEAVADFIKNDSYGDSILHDVAIYGILRTIEIIFAARLKGIDINATYQAGRTVHECAQLRDFKPAGFVEAFWELLDSISFQDSDGMNDFCERCRRVRDLAIFRHLRRNHVRCRRRFLQ